MTAISTVIVDDQDDIRFLIRMILEMDDPPLTIIGEAASGAEAVDLVDRLQPDCVILDIMMPGMDGIQAARLIRERRPDQKILFCSAHVDGRLAQNVDALRHERCLSKDEVDALPSEVRTMVAA